MQIKKIITGAVASLALLVTGLNAASADPFATFSQTGGALFTFTNTGSSSNFLVTGSIPVAFTYLVPNAYDPTFTTTAGTMTFSSIVSSKAVTVGSLIDQPMDDVNFVITADSPKGGKTDLLTLTTSTGDLVGKTGTTEPSLSGDTGTGDTVTFSSDFLDFTNVTEEAYNFSFTLSKGDLFTLNSNKYVNTFTSVGSGNFSSDPIPTIPGGPVPEPATTASFVLGGLGLLAMGLFARKNRKMNNLTA
jgi:hypothetical protein